MHSSIHPSIHHLLAALSASARWCRCSLSFLPLPDLVFPPLTIKSPSNRKQMGDFCCRLLPNGANSHYSVGKRCYSSPPPPPHPPRTILPSDVSTLVSNEDVSCWYLGPVSLFWLDIKTLKHPDTTAVGEFLTLENRLISVFIIVWIITWLQEHSHNNILYMIWRHDAGRRLCMCLTFGESLF